MKMAATRSPKFRRLMRVTGMNRATAAGTLELLWLFAMEQAPAGDVGRWSDDDLEAELDWQGQAGELITALLQCGWLDESANHRLVIHDWADHLPEFLQKRVVRKTLEIATDADDVGGQQSSEGDGGGQRQTVADDGGNVAIREGKRSQAKGSQEESKRGDDPCILPKGYETGERIAPLLIHAAKSTDQERTLWLEAYWPQIVATAENKLSAEGGELAAHVKSYAISKWQFYLQKRDPSTRQFYREAVAKESAAALAASKAAESAQPSEELADDGPLGDLFAGQPSQGAPH